MLSLAAIQIHERLWGLSLMLGDQVWLSVSVAVHHKGVGWGWGHGSVQASQALQHQTGKPISLWDGCVLGNLIMLTTNFEAHLCQNIIVCCNAVAIFPFTGKSPNHEKQTQNNRSSSSLSAVRPHYLSAVPIRHTDCEVLVYFNLLYLGFTCIHINLLSGSSSWLKLNSASLAYINLCSLHFLTADLGRMITNKK